MSRTRTHVFPAVLAALTTALTTTTLATFSTLATLTTLATITAPPLAAQWGGGGGSPMGGSSGGGGHTSSPPARSAPAPRATPTPRTPTPRATPGPRSGGRNIPAPRGEQPGSSPWGRQIPRPKGSPENQIVPSPTGGVAVEVGGGGRAPLIPVSPTLDSVSASPREKTRALHEAREFRGLRVPGREVRASVDKLLKLHWHKKLAFAAREARRDQKPILWIQTLGDLRGFT